MRRALPKYGTDEYHDCIDEISEVLKHFFGKNDKFNVKSEAHRVFSTYDNFVSDAWSRQEAQTHLDQLEDAIVRLRNAYDALPDGLRVGLNQDASHIDWLAQQEFLEKTNLSLVTKAHLPEERGKKAALALGDVNAGSEELQRAIRYLNKRLPEGIATRNRPMSDWAVVEAAADLCRVKKLMNVPNSLGRESPFFRLLEALFDVFGADTTPIGAFKGWKEHFDINREKFKLLDM